MVAALVSVSGAGVIYYDSHATGANDGSSWLNAYTDLATALTSASDGDEVRVRQGVHYPISTSSGSAIALPNVRLIGGYTGENETARTNDPRATVFCGDIGDNDIYLDGGGSAVADTAVSGTAGKAFNPANGSFIAFRAWNDTEKYWKLDSSKTSDNVQKLFTVPDAIVSDYSQRIEGITFTGFGRANSGSILTTGKTAHMVITNCDFIANFSKPTSSPGLIVLQSDSNIEGCRFFGTHGGQILYSALGSTSTNAIVRGCEMKYIYSSEATGGCPAGVNASIKNGKVTILDCDFAFINARMAANGGGGVVVGRIYGTLSAVRDCTFSHIVSEGNTYANSMILGDPNLTGCTFTDCILACNSKTGSFISSTNPSNIVVRNCHFTTETTGTACLLYASGNALLVESGFYGNSITATSAANVYLISAGMGIGVNQLPCTDLYAVRNSLIGGSTAASLFSSQTACLMNSIIAKNTFSGFGENAIVSTFRRTGVYHIAWSTIYDNDSPVEFYGNQSSYNHNVYLTSSIVWREADSPFTPTASTLISKGSIVFRNSCVKGLASGNTGVAANGSGSNNSIGVFTGNPCFRDKIIFDGRGRPYVQLEKASPYTASGFLPRMSLDDTASNAKTGAITFKNTVNGKREAAHNNLYNTSTTPGSEAFVADFLGEPRVSVLENPENSAVVLGAVQSLHRSAGLRVFVQ